MPSYMTKQQLIDLIKDPEVLNATADKMLEIIESGISDRLARVIDIDDDAQADPNDTRIIGTPVEITERHVGCLVQSRDKNDVLWGVSDYHRWETANDLTDNLSFPDIYPIPITHQWFGGPCPVDRRMTVLVQFRNEEFSIDEAEIFFWEHDPYSADEDIIGYTVLDIRGITGGES